MLFCAFFCVFGLKSFFFFKCFFFKFKIFFFTQKYSYNHKIRRQGTLGSQRKICAGFVTKINICWFMMILVKKKKRATKCCFFTNLSSKSAKIASNAHRFANLWERNNPNDQKMQNYSNFLNLKKKFEFVYFPPFYDPQHQFWRF